MSPVRVKLKTKDIFVCFISEAKSWQAWEKVLAVKPDDLSSTLETHMAEERDSSSKLCSDLQHVYSGVCAQKLTVNAWGKEASTETMHVLTMKWLLDWEYNRICKWNAKIYRTG